MPQPLIADTASGSTASLALPGATEVAFIQFDYTRKDFMLDVGQTIGNQLPELAVEQRCRIGLQTEQIGSRSSGNLKHETLDQLELVLSA